MATTVSENSSARLHAGEEKSNSIRQQIAQLEPRSLRTYTPTQAVIARSQGSYHWTPEGRKLADFTSGVLVANLGHHPRLWWKRLHEYLAIQDNEEGNEFLSAVPMTAYNALTELEAEASRRLIANMQAQPGGARCEQVNWAASGSEAVQKALWAAMARRPGQEIVLATRKGFHGKKGLSNAITGDEHSPERDPRVKFLSFPVQECENLDHRRQPLDLAPYEQELQQYWQEFGSQICAIATEPYLGGGGSYHPQPEYLQLLQNFCREHDILLILDEVQSNFGRTGTMYAYTSYGIEPDIVVLGKGLGNGIAVSAAVGRADVFASLDYGATSDTWSGNPLSCAAVLATLDAFEQSNVLEQAAELANVIERGLVRLQTETDLVAHIRGEGTVWGIECAAFASHSAAEVANACVEACYLGDANGAAIHLLGPLAGKVIRVSPPLVMPIDEAEHYFDVMLSIFQHLQRSLDSPAN